MDEIDQAIAVLSRRDFREIQSRGYHFQKNDYYSPLNDLAFLDANRDLWATAREPAAIDWRLPGQIQVATEVSAFVGELRDIPEKHRPDRLEYCWDNDFWNNADAIVQYGLVRSRRPRRYVEIGCGWSSLLLEKAVMRNGIDCVVTLVEPYPNRAVLALLPKHWQHHECTLQRAPMHLFDALGPGDVLFYDGSHCAKAAGDVNHFFFQVLPRIKPGVLVHLHDIFFPHDYPEEWMFRRGQTWNEQYVLQAFLMHNSRYRVLIANQYLHHHCQAQLESLYQGVQPTSGVSFWMEKVE